MDATTADRVGDTETATGAAVAAAISAMTERAFPLDATYASTDASPVDATVYIQSVLDACEAAGGGTVAIPSLPDGYHFFHTFNNLGDYTMVAGSGRRSSI